MTDKHKDSSMLIIKVKIEKLISENRKLNNSSFLLCGNSEINSTYIYERYCNKH